MCKVVFYYGFTHVCRAGFRKRTINKTELPVILSTPVFYCHLSLCQPSILYIYSSTILLLAFF